jgi:5-methylcytosine-specific restriction enzyme subunit McrC
MRLTTFEQSALAVRSQADERTNCLATVQALTVVDAGERMGARIAEWQGLRSLRIQQFVGVVRTRELQLEILPKLEGLAEPAQIRQSLLRMLAITQDLEVRDSEVVSFLESSEPFFWALARLYIHRLLEAVRRGLRQDYVLHQELLPYIRGKVHWPSQAKLQTTGRLEFACAFDERSEDTPLNRTLKAALLVAGRMLEGARISSIVTELRHAMDGVSETCPSADQRARLRTDRMNRHMEPLLVLAKLILGNRNPDLGRSADGNRDTYALVWDMNVLFEEYVGRLAREVFEAKGLRVVLQKGTATYLAQEILAGRNAFLLRPDILVQRERKPWVVADTKWKHLDPRQASLGVSESDVYQVLAYAHRFETDRAVLIYPHHPALGLPGLQQELLIQGRGPEVRVRIVTLDLARLDDVPEQIVRGLVGEPAASSERSLSPAAASEISPVA